MPAQRSVFPWYSSGQGNPLSRPISPSQEPSGTEEGHLGRRGIHLTSAYSTLHNDVNYNNPGSRHFDAIYKEKTALRLVRGLESLGCQAQLDAA